MRENEEHLVENVSDGNQHLLQFFKTNIEILFCLKIIERSFHTGSSNSWRTKEVMVVTVPKKRFAQARQTNAVLGTVNRKLAGYMRGIDDTLLKLSIKTAHNVM